MTSIDYKEMYDQYWKHALKRGEEDSGDLELSMLFLKKANLLRKQQSILEIGCAIGKLSNALHDMGYHNITGIDIASSAITFGKNRFPHLNIYRMDANSLKFPKEHFDICFSFDLVEHLPDVNAHFKEVWRILKPRGNYLFQTPNILSNSLITTIQNRGLGWKVFHPSLQFPWTLKEKLLNSGFVKVEFIKISPLSSHKIQEVPKFARWAFKHMPWKIFPLFLQIGFYVVAYK